MRLIILILFTVLITGLGASAQMDSAQNALRNTNLTTDSVTLAKPVTDTLPAGIRMPDSLRHNRFIDTLLKQYALNPFQFSSPGLRPHQRSAGHERPSRNTWVVVVILCLLIYAGLLNRMMSRDIYNVVLAFYLKTSFAKLSKEDNLLTSWAFIGLFLLFGFTIGLYIYQVTVYNNFMYPIRGFQLFIACSVLVIILAAVKIMLLRVLGFIFDIQRLISEYIAILYLTYFNIAFIFLPVVICFSLFPSASIHSLLVISVFLIVIVVAIQYVRSILNIISNFSFHKIYLFIYLCALEICPVLILIKTLNL